MRLRWQLSCWILCYKCRISRKSKTLQWVSSKPDCGPGHFCYGFRKLWKPRKPCIFIKKHHMDSKQTLQFDRIRVKKNECDVSNIQTLGDEFLSLDELTVRLWMKKTVCFRPDWTLIIQVITYDIRGILLSSCFSRMLTSTQNWPKLVILVTKFDLPIICWCMAVIWMESRNICYSLLIASYHITCTATMKELLMTCVVQFSPHFIVIVGT